MLRRSIRASSAAAARYFSAPATSTYSTTSAVAQRDDSRGKAVLRSGDTLCRRLINVAHTRQSAVFAAQKWKEEGREVRKFELFQAVKELRKLKRYKQALQMFEWMVRQENIELVLGDYAVHLDLVAKVHGLTKAEEFFDDLPAHLKGKATYTALLHAYVQNKEVDQAEALMDKMSEHGFLKYAHPHNHMLRLYISTGQTYKIPKVIKELKRNTSPDLLTYNLLLSVCASQNDVEGAEKEFQKLRRAKLVPDWVTHSTLANLYVKMGMEDKARANLTEMEKWYCKESRVSYSSLISLYTGLGDKNSVKRIWKKLKTSYSKLHDVEYTSMIASLIKLKDIQMAETKYMEWRSVTGLKDTRVPNILLSAYINKNQIEKAESFCGSMVKGGIYPSYTTWELLTWGYLKQQNVDRTLTYFKKAIGSVKKWNPDEGLLGDIFSLVEEQGKIQAAEELLLLLRQAGHVTIQTYNCLLKTYAKAGKTPLEVAERMKKDRVLPKKETRKLIEETSKLLTTDASSCLLT